MGELPQEQEKETARPFDGGYKMGSLEIIVLVIIFAFIAWATYGFVQSSDVMIAMEPNNEESFSAFAYHKENKKVWTIDANGIVEQSPTKSQKPRNWLESGWRSMGRND